MEKMKIYESIIFLLGGIGVFIIAMRLMSQNLQKFAGSGMKKLLLKLTNNRLLGVGIGAIVAAIIQSSSASTVMMIGLVNSESITLQQATSIIMGINIGSTSTGLIVSLQSFGISLFFILLIFIGVMLIFLRNDSLTNFGGIFCGLGLIFVSLNLMNEPFQTEYIKIAFIKIFKQYPYPFLLIMIGIIVTGVIQYSSAILGITITLAQNDIIDIENALFIVIGLNMGKCITVIINSLGANINAKRAGLIHLLFNIFGAVLFTIFIYPLKKYVANILDIIFSSPSMQISLFHFFFNFLTTLILLPFSNLFVSLVCIFFKEDPQNINNNETRRIRKELKFISKRFLLSPQIAVMQVQKEIKNMALLAKTNYDQSIDQLFTQDELNSEEILSRGELIDYINIETTKFLVKLAPKIDETLADDMATYFNLLNDIKRIGDHAINFLEESNKMKEKNIKFSLPALDDLKEVNLVVSRMFSIIDNSFDSISNKELIEIEELNQKVEKLQTEGPSKNFDRLTRGLCTMEAGEFFTSAFSHFNSISSHLNSIGHCLAKGSHSKSSIDNKDYSPVMDENDKQRIETLDSKSTELNISS